MTNVERVRKQYSELMHERKEKFESFISETFQKGVAFHMSYCMSPPELQEECLSVFMHDFMHDFLESCVTPTETPKESKRDDGVGFYL